MQLAFIWIKKYDPIIEQGFTFSDKYIFSYDRNRTELNIVDNDFYIEDFFNVKNNQGEVSRINNITALVGENGAGKSTILNFIKQNLVYGQANSSEAIIGLLDQLNVLHIYHHEDLKILHGNFRKKAKIHSYKGNELCNLFKSISFIYFSNIFDHRYEEEVSGIQNISTNYMLKNDVIRLKETNELFPEVTQMAAYTFSEIHRQLSFIHEFKGENWLNFTLPQEIIITPVNFNLDELKKKSDFKIYEKEVRSLDKALKEVQIQAKGSIAKKAAFFRAILINFFYEYSMLSYLPNVTHLFITEELQGQTVFGKAFDLLRGVIKVLNQTIHVEVIEWVISVVEVLKFITKCLENEKLVWDAGIKVSIESSNGIGVYELLAIYSRSFRFNHFLEFKWRNLSSGEQARLNMYSRFHYLSDSQQRASNTDLGDYVCILIDEGELYYHPQWQKRLIKDYIEHLPILLKRRDGRPRNIQLILTSNSPFVVSDLPKSNVLLLKNREGIIVVENELEQHKETFAANIHTLLSDSFFMRDGLMGEFSRVKLNDLISLLIDSDEKEYIEKQEFARKMSRVVGEPIIEKKLKAMIIEKEAALKEQKLEEKWQRKDDQNKFNF